MDFPKVETMWFGELETKEFPPDQFLVGHGLLPKNGLLFVGGPPKSYKSFVAQTMAFELCVGKPLFGAYKSHGATHELIFAVDGPQRVLFLEQEIGFYDVRERMLPYFNSLLEPDKQRIRENFAIHSRDHEMRLDTDEGLKRIEAIIQATKPTVVVFDPLIEFHAENENDAQAMQRVLHGVDILRDTYNFATIITHHSGKPQTMSTREGPDELRGSSVIFGKADSVMMIKPENRAKGFLNVGFTIRRSRPIQETLRLVLDWTELRAKFNGWGKGEAEGPAKAPEKTYSGSLQ